MFFLPTLYKKFRTRVLVKGINYFRGLLSVRSMLSSIVFFFEIIRGFGVFVFNFLYRCVSRLRFFDLNVCFTVNSAVFANFSRAGLFTLLRYYLNLTAMGCVTEDIGVAFTKYNKL